MTEPTDNGEWEACDDCGGTGRDEQEWDGKCLKCSGKGDVWVEPYHENDEGDH